MRVFGLVANLWEQRADTQASKASHANSSSAFKLFTLEYQEQKVEVPITENMIGLPSLRLFVCVLVYILDSNFLKSN